MEKNNCFRNILTYFLILSLLIGTYYFPVTVFASEGEGISPRTPEDWYNPEDIKMGMDYLLSNKVKDANGNWVTRNGVYHSKWDKYNCYSYAIHISDAWHKAGEINGKTYEEADDVTIQDLVGFVKDDLEAMGYSNIEFHDEIPQINENQELICVRKTNSESDRQDFHYMRYDYATDAWYHKPGRNAILKFNGTPENATHWRYETVDEEGIWYFPNIEYAGEIVFITYSKNLLTIGESETKSINKDKEILCEINVETAGEYKLRFSSLHIVEYALYNEDLDIVISGNGRFVNTDFQATAGTYYLRMNFETYNAGVGQVNVSVTNESTNEHTHSYTYQYITKSDTTHWSYCACGERISQAHVVSTSHSTTCMLCNGNVSGGILNSIPSDLPHTENGSCILPNGVIVLVPEDEEAYFNGTLVFRTGELM